MRASNSLYLLATDARFVQVRGEWVVIALGIIVKVCPSLMAYYHPRYLNHYLSLHQSLVCLLSTYRCSYFSYNFAGANAAWLDGLFGTFCDKWV